MVQLELFEEARSVGTPKGEFYGAHGNEGS